MSQSAELRPTDIQIFSALEKTVVPIGAEQKKKR